MIGTLECCICSEGKDAVVMKEQKTVLWTEE